jgi:CRISPR-associated endonuclease/helicase Cas3
MANIEPLIATAALLLRFPKWPADSCVHLCVYHSRFPLLMRSAIEAVLDDALMRKHNASEPDPFSQHLAVQAAIAKAPLARNHIFVVLASPVAEVGRDHDYDWAIVEPSSMRSIIQLAGRVRRHRDAVVNAPNIVLMSRNIKSLRGKAVCFDKPGFEDAQHHLASHDLTTLLHAEEFKRISAAPRIQARAVLSGATSLVDLEHQRLAELLLASQVQAKGNIRRFWQSQIALTGVAQTQQKFRKGPPMMNYFLSGDLDADGKPKLKRMEISGKPSEALPYQRMLPTIAPNIALWPVEDIQSELADLAERLNMSEAICAERFATLQLEVDEENRHRDWVDCGALGFRRGS